MNPTQRRLRFIGSPDRADDGAETELLLFEADGTTPIPGTDRPVHYALQAESFQRRIVAIGTGGSQQYLSVSASRKFDETRDFEGTVVLFQNITDLIDAIRTREQIVAGVSHEFAPR